MKGMEDVLKDRKKEFDSIEVPMEMEEKLRAALNRKKRGISKGVIAGVLIAILVFAYSFDALAYYGKKILGYDEVAYGSIKNLMEEGSGQSIGKSCTFSNGMEFTLDGILFDDNEFVTFYKLHSKDGELDTGAPMFKLLGLKPGGYFQQSGHGKILDEYTQVWMQSFESPAFYEKWMKLSIQYKVGGKFETQEIRFSLNRKAAMKKMAKQKLDAQIKLDPYDIHFEAMSASAMSTVFEGGIIPLTEEAAKAFKAEDAISGLESPTLRFDIMADDENVGTVHAGMGVSNEVIHFTAKSEALPKECKTLALKNIGMERRTFIDRSVSIRRDTRELSVAEDLVIKKVEVTNDTTIITVASRGIPGMGLFVEDTQVMGEDTNGYTYEAESQEPVDRVYTFKGSGEDMTLSVKTIRYTKFSDTMVSIPVE